MNRILLPHIATMIFNCPLMITQAKLFEILYFLGPQIGVNALDEKDFEAAASKSYVASDHEYKKENGMAIIPIFGTLMHRDMGLNALSGNTSYQGLRAQIQDALEDKTVKSILLDIDSNGGEVAGVFALADEIYKAREQKPIYAIANEAAYSAAYLLGSAANEFYLSKTAGVGSIGVIALHVDTSKADAEKGLKYTPIYRGSKKMDLNPHYPISDDAKKEVQAKVDQVYDLFISTVARNRGIEEKAIKGTEAGIFMGEEAVKIGLADGVMDFSNTIDFINSNEGGFKMGFFFKAKDGAEIDLDALNAKLSTLEAENKKLTEDLANGTKQIETLKAEQVQIKNMIAETEKKAVESERTRITGIIDAFAASNIDDLKILTNAIKDGTSIEAARTRILAILAQASQAQTIASAVHVNDSGQGNPLLENAKARAEAARSRRN